MRMSDAVRRLASLVMCLHCSRSIFQPVYGVGADKGGASSKPGDLKPVLEVLEDLWDETQYAEELSLPSFTNKLSAGK